VTLRGILFTLIFIFWTATCCFAYAWAIPLASRAYILRKARWYVGTVAWLERHILHLTYEVEGTLPRSGKFIIAMKHESAWETMKLHVLFDDPAIILKRELLSIFLWGKFLARLDMIAIDRSSGSEALKQMVESIATIAAANRPLVIFPQGTRVAPLAKSPYRTGIAKMYKVANLAVIPVALNAGLFWPKSFWKKRPGKITLKVLEPILPGLPAKEFMTLLEQRLEAASDNLAINYA
jgi:1-acyl-sn-glycerol-3-phosphate acyltransferase